MKVIMLDPMLLFPEHEKRLKALGEFKKYESAPQNDEDAIDRMKDADIVVDFWFPLTQEILQKVSGVKMICSAASGYDWIDVGIASQKNIVVTHCPGHNAESVAEHTIGLILNAIRFSTQASDELKHGNFSFGKYQGKELKGKTLGIIGHGHIGKRILEIAEKGFGMNVIYTDSKSTREEFEKLLKESDVISVNAPLNKNTENLFGGENLQ